MRRRTTWASALVASSGPTATRTRSALFFSIGDVPARLMDQPRNLFQFHVVDLLGTVVSRVVVGMEAGHEAERRNAALQEWPLVAAAHELRAVVVVALLEFEADALIRSRDRCGEIRYARVSHDIDGVRVRLRRLHVETVEAG